ncbi:CHRD domain-containing protein [Streptomyces sp. NPDC057638]|uniref:CHRD domain-containing protein n=1 Tax=Streptomyces sp. NPDC057638 TaxID=3346190 RepID=UPI0036BEA87F
MKRTMWALVGATAVAAATGVSLAVLPAFASDGTSAAAPHAGHGAAGAVAADGRGPAAAPKAAQFFLASLNGANEVQNPGGPIVGDSDGVALQFVKVEGNKVSVAIKFRATQKPTMLHIHQGVRGVNGGIKIDLTPLAGGVKPINGWTGSVQGSVTVTDAAALDAFTKNPNGHYANFHTAEFPGGAVRGQFHKVTSAFPFEKALTNFQASVVTGDQIYECKTNAGGAPNSFQQRDVTATLAGHIAHSFVAPNSGKPQWIATDRSAITGALIKATPNGEDNIAELDLKATQSGAATGLFATTQELFRLNTVGGVAPNGTCRVGQIVKVPYGADYVFLQK